MTCLVDLLRLYFILFFISFFFLFHSFLIFSSGRLFSFQFSCLDRPTLAEALALKEVLSWLKDIYNSQIVNEMDAIYVVQATARGR